MSENVLAFILVAFPVISIASVTILFFIVVKPRNILEWLASILLIFLLVGYYSEIFTAWFFYANSSNTYISNLLFLFSYNFAQISQFFSGIHINYGGLDVGPYSLLTITGSDSYTRTLWPIIIFALGLLLRYSIHRFVRHEKLRRLTLEYWLFLTLYIVASYWISQSTSWSFWSLFGTLILLITLYATNLFEVFVDILSLMAGIYEILKKVGGIVRRYIAYVAAEISKILRKLAEKIRYLYRKYIVEPISIIYKRIMAILTNWQNLIDQKLEDQEFEE